MKNEILRRIKQESATVTPESLPSFYTAMSAELASARDTFFSHPMVLRCREDVLPFLNDEFGHGIEHSKKVAIEASALVLGEAKALGFDAARRLALMAMLSGLLHDTCRLEGEHASRGAELSLMILRDYPLTDDEKQMIASAVRCHEAFSPPMDFGHDRTQLLADALYDADKFRWGPDNFMTTLWEICNYQEWTLEQILDKFPAGLEMVAAVQNTFRTPAGKIYGPEFIELGLNMGRKIYLIIQTFCQKNDCSGRLIP
ncbi:HD domain-containing protein [Desulfomicrobium salsuginis]